MEAAGPAPPDEATERELARLREELALALVARDEAQAEAASTGKHAETAAQREREEALEALRAEHAVAHAADQLYRGQHQPRPGTDDAVARAQGKGERGERDEGVGQCDDDHEQREQRGAQDDAWRHLMMDFTASARSA